MQHLGKNVVFVLALVAAGFLIAWLRFRPYLEGAGNYSDGSQTYDVSEDATVRYAIWDPAIELAGEINSHEDERAPATTPDGRHMVFSTGDQASDLWICDFEDGRPRNPRPLTELNSGSADIAPAFSQDYLYFASDRAGTAGGFDLWRAAYAEGEFGAVERLGGGVNTAADECDPAPVGGDDELAFASNRSAGARPKADFDLYRASWLEAGEALVTPLTGLNTDANERDPACTQDGRALFFASDRQGTYDLYRSALGQAEEELTFLEPRLLKGLATEAAEREPSPSHGGFTLTFSSQLEGRDADLLQANSRELFRRPGRPIGWMELVVLGALLLLALLAKLSTRWSGLEVLYKCLLVSILAHLLLLWWFRNIYPESEAVEFEEDGPRIRVHLIADHDASVARNAERSGSLNAQRVAQNEAALERMSIAQVEDSGEEAPHVEVQVAAAPEAAAPVRRESGEQRGDFEAREVDVNREVEVASLRGAEAPRLAQELAQTGARSARGASSTPERRLAVGANLAAPIPGAGRVAKRARPEMDLGPLLVRAEAEFDRASRETNAEATLRRPLDSGAGSVSRAARSAPVAALDVGAAKGFGVDRSLAAGELEQRDTSRALATGEMLPTFGRLDRGTDKRDSLRAPERTVAQDRPEPLHSRELVVDLAVETPAQKPVQPAVRARAEEPDLQVASFARSTRRTELETQPAKFAREAPAPALVPEFKPLAVAVAAPRDEAVVKRERWDHTPYQARSGTAKLRALEEHGGTVETERAVAAGLAYLAEQQRSGGNWGRTHWEDDKYLETTVGKTGLSLLAFLGAGHTQHSASEYSRVVDEAIGFLLEAQDDRTGHFGLCSSYGHAIATYALAECFALTKDQRLRAPLARATRQITRHQIDSRDERLDGGWGYYYPDGRTFDRWSRASVTVWQVMALESARLGGLEIEDEVFARAKRFLLGCWDRRRGAFRYSHDPERLSSGYPVLPGSTPASLFALSILGVDVSLPGFGPARAYVLDRKPTRYAPRSNDAFVERAEGNLYFWYYSTLSLFRAGGKAWDEWNGAMKTTLLDAQSEDGSWAPESPYSREYAGDTNRDRCYSTAMCVLSLEVYYRYFTPLLKVE